MKIDTQEYKHLADRLLQDKAIKELGTDLVLCYRKADEREIEASQAIRKLLDYIELAEDELERYAVCGTCKYYEKCKERFGRDRNGISTEYNYACYKWKWRGGLLDER